MARILVVEDNPQNLKLTTIILEGAGHRVTPARDADEAARALEGALPDLIVMDISLPGRDGYELTRELRRSPRTAEVPILVLTALAMPDDARKAYAAGCTAYMTKPIRRAMLLEHVGSLLPPDPESTVSRAGRAPTPPEEPEIEPT